MLTRKNMAPILLAAAMVLAVAAAFGAKYYIASKAESEAARKTRAAPVVVAAEDVPAGVELAAKQLTLAQWPQDARPAGHFAAAAPLVGRVLQQPLVKNEPVLLGKLAPKGMSAGLAAVVTPGMRAVTLSADEIVGVAGYLKPGDRVDVVATVKATEQSKDAMSRLTLQDVEVLSVRHNAEGEGKKAPKLKAQVITLLVAPPDSERLALAASEGKIVLALRNRQDRVMAKTQGARMTALFPVAAAPVVAATPQINDDKPARPTPPPPPTVEVIKGMARTRQELRP